MLVGLFTPENLGGWPDAYVGKGFKFDGGSITIDPVQKPEKAFSFQTDAADTLCLYIEENFVYIPAVCDDTGKPII